MINLHVSEELSFEEYRKIDKSEVKSVELVPSDPSDFTDLEVRVRVTYSSAMYLTKSRYGKYP